MIAERAVVGVFHDAHKLDGVVSGLNDARKGMFTEFGISANLSIFLSHANMGFIDEGVANAFFWVGMAPGVGGGRIPDLSGKYVGLWVLNGSPGIGRYAFAAATRPKCLQFVEVFVLDGF